jgi:hypothetical protein
VLVVEVGVGGGLYSGVGFEEMADCFREGPLGLQVGGVGF